MNSPDLSAARWFKSSRSGGGQNCVETAFVPDYTGVRDTKDRDGGTLVIGARAWTAFIDAIKDHKLDQ